MDDALQEMFGGDTDLASARTSADRIAALVNSRVLPNSEIVIRADYCEPHCPFKVSFHTKAFHCFFLVSDASYCFNANRRPKTPWVEDFRVSMKEPDHVGGTRILAAGLSKLIGVKVFCLPRSANDAVEVAFSTGILDLLRRIQFNRVQLFHFSPIRLDVVASLDSPESCVEQARLFQELVTLANREAYERNKNVLG